MHVGVGRGRLELHATHVVVGVAELGGVVAVEIGRVVGELHRHVAFVEHVVQRDRACAYPPSQLVERGLVHGSLCRVGHRLAKALHGIANGHVFALAQRVERHVGGGGIPVGLERVLGQVIHARHRAEVHRHGHVVADVGSRGLGAVRGWVIWVIQIHRHELPLHIVVNGEVVLPARTCVVVVEDAFGVGRPHVLVARLARLQIVVIEYSLDIGAIGILRAAAFGRTQHEGARSIERIATRGDAAQVVRKVKVKRLVAVHVGVAVPPHDNVVVRVGARRQIAKKVARHVRGLHDPAAVLVGVGDFLGGCYRSLELVGIHRRSVAAR